MNGRAQAGGQQSSARRALLTPPCSHRARFEMLAIDLLSHCVWPANLAATETYIGTTIVFSK